MFLKLKVAKIDIGYAKTAKKLDVKRLKRTIWDILTENEEDKVCQFLTWCRKEFFAENF